MKKDIFLLIFVFLSFSSCIQENEKIYDVKKYNQEIQNAESSIISFDYTSALKNYNNSLKYVHKPLGTDCYNALLVSVYSEKWDEAVFWSKILFDKGVELDFFNSEIFKNFRESSHWDDLVQQYQIHHQNFVKTKDASLIKTFKELVVRDQETYCLIPVEEGYDTFDAFNETVDFDKEIAILLKKNPFLTEEKIGLNITNDTTLNFLPVYYPLIRHSFQANEMKSFLDVIKDNVNEGYLKKEVLEKTTETPLSNPIIKIDTNFYIQNVEYSNNDTIKKEIERLKYLIQNSHRKFILPLKLSELEFKSKQEKESFLNDYKLLISLN